MLALFANGEQKPARKQGRTLKLKVTPLLTRGLLHLKRQLNVANGIRCHFV
jgi:hypothetical protein